MYNGHREWDCMFKSVDVVCYGTYEEVGTKWVKVQWIFKKNVDEHHPCHIN
jgi:hypothetical protein